MACELHDWRLRLALLSAIRDIHGMSLVRCFVVATPSLVTTGFCICFYSFDMACNLHGAFLRMHNIHFKSCQRLQC